MYHSYIQCTVVTMTYFVCRGYCSAIYTKITSIMGNTSNKYVQSAFCTVEIGTTSAILSICLSFLTKS